jgi:hypothetical protein
MKFNIPMINHFPLKSGFYFVIFLRLGIHPFGNHEYKYTKKTTNGVIRMQTMTIKEFMNKGNMTESQTLTLLEQQQWDMMKLTFKAILIVSTVALPLSLDQILNFTNGALQPNVEAYVNQFSPSTLIDIMRGVK